MDDSERIGTMVVAAPDPRRGMAPVVAVTGAGAAILWASGYQVAGVLDAGSKATTGLQDAIGWAAVAVLVLPFAYALVGLLTTLWWQRPPEEVAVLTREPLAEAAQSARDATARAAGWAVATLILVFLCVIVTASAGEVPELIGAVAGPVLAAAFARREMRGRAVELGRTVRAEDMRVRRLVEREHVEERAHGGSQQATDAAVVAAVTRALAAVPARLDATVATVLRDNLSGPPLQNFDGRIALSVRETAVSAEVVVDIGEMVKGEVEAPVRIRDGIRSETVEFEIELSSNLLGQRSMLRTVAIGHGESQQHVFQLGEELFAFERPWIWLRLVQRGQTIQNLELKRGEGPA